MSTSRFVITNQTRDDILVECRTIAKKIVPNWDSSDPNDIGVFLMELGAALSESNNFYANLLTNEAFIQTANDPKNINFLASYQRYRRRTSQPSRVKLSIKINQIHTDDIVIPAFTLKVANEDSYPKKIYYENEFAITIPQGSTYIEGCIFIEGQSKTVSFTADGLDFQSYLLPDSSIIVDEIAGALSDYGVHITVINPNTSVAVSYRLVDLFALNTPTDHPFMLQTRANDTLLVSFSDGTLGTKPLQGYTIQADYRIGGGISLIDPTKISEFVSIKEALPTGISFTEISNPEMPYGGAAAEDYSYTKRAVPLLGSNVHALIDEKLIEYAAQNIAGVARSKMTLIGNVFTLIIVPIGGGQPTQTLLDYVKTVIHERIGINYLLNTHAPSYREVTRVIKVYTKSPYKKLDIYNAVRTTINRRLNTLSKDSDGYYLNEFGASLELSDFGYLLKEISPIYDYEVLVPANSITIDSAEILTHTNTPARKSISGHASGKYITVEAATPISLANKLQIQFATPVAADISSTFTDLGSTLQYVIKVGTDPGQSSLTAIKNFINSDPHLVMVHGTLMGDGTEIIGDTRLLRCTSVDDVVDDSSFTYALTPLDTVFTTNFDIIVVGGVL